MEFIMWRLIAFILICALFLVFVVLNLEHTSDVSLGFRTFNEIPVFLTAFSAFVLGMLFATPFVLSFGRKNRKSSRTPYNTPPSVMGEKPSAGQKKSSGSKKKKDFSEARGERDQILSVDPSLGEIKKENSPYGID